MPVTSHLAAGISLVSLDAQWESLCTPDRTGFCGLSCTAARKVARPHMFNPYEVSSFQEKQRIEKLLCSGDVLRPHKAGDAEMAPAQATS